MKLNTIRINENNNGIDLVMNGNVVSHIDSVITSCNIKNILANATSYKPDVIELTREVVSAYILGLDSTKYFNWKAFGIKLEIYG